MVLTVKDYEDGFTSCVTLFNSDKKTHTPLKESITSGINDQFFQTNKWLAQVIALINNCIAILERRDANLSDVWVSFINLHKYFSTLNNETLPQKYLEIASFAKERLSVRASAFEEPVYLIALYLSPTYRKYAFPRNLLNEIYISGLRKTLFHNLKKWVQLLPHSSKKLWWIMATMSNPITNPKRFWQAMPSSKLKDYALMIFSLCPSSANIERLFSKLSRTKTKYRNRMSEDTSKYWQNQMRYSESKTDRAIRGRGRGCGILLWALSDGRRWALRSQC